VKQRRARPKKSPARSGRGASAVVLENRGRLRKPAETAAARYLLRLYVTGTTPGSLRAIEGVRALLEEHLHGRYELEVVDIYQLPTLARDHQIVATPTLIKVLPQPLRRFIGDLSSSEKVLFGLDLREKPR